MRHRVKGRKLGRTTPHRKATLRALSTALIKEHRIETTVPKAKELRTFIEPLITTAKVDNNHNRRKVFSKLQDKYAVTELFETVAPEVGDRPGGYTRVLKLGFRLGDAAEMAVIELVDFNDVKPEEKSTRKKRTRRAGKSNKPDTDNADTSDKKEEKKKVKPEADQKPVEKEDVSDSKVSAEENKETKEVSSQTEGKSESDTEAAKDAEEKSESDKKE